MPGIVDQLANLISERRYAEAVAIATAALERNPDSWELHYFAGLSLRWLDRYEEAVQHLERATKLAPRHPPILLALGIARQKSADYPGAVVAFGEAIAADPDYERAYNSLAMTQKLMGEYDKASHNYDAGAQALARRIIRSMTNDRENPALPHVETRNGLWISYSMSAALFIASKENISSLAWPTGESAIEEQRTRRHEGLYWTDVDQDNGERARLCLPNYFATFAHELRRSGSFAHLMGNRSTVLGILGRHDEARQHREEAEDFEPRAAPRPSDR